MLVYINTKYNTYAMQYVLDLWVR